MSRRWPAPRPLQRVRNKFADIKARRNAAELAADVIEHGDGVTAVFDAPGIDPEDVDVRFHDGRVVATAERDRESFDGYRRTVTSRRLVFEGEVAIPGADEIEPGTGEATVRADGTLAVTMPTVPRPGDAEGTDRVESAAQD